MPTDIWSSPLGIREQEKKKEEEYDKEKEKATLRRELVMDT